ncbi:MAG: glycine cleavage system aminomethyltransferase GcvT [Desulfobacterales bacterium]|jgi:aminomethyltransferase
MASLLKTPLYGKHLESGGTMVDFGGWEMPVQYTDGIIAEHLATRREAGLFDVSHMGRFVIRGRSSLAFLQRVLTNNAAALDVGQSQYTMIPSVTGGALDDAYLYRFFEDDYLLVVNAANRQNDWKHLRNEAGDYEDLHLEDRTAELAMISLQGPRSKKLLSGLLQEGAIPEPEKNALSMGIMAGADIWLARTGYTGESLGFELFLPADAAADIWTLLTTMGAAPVGLGARDTLRLEAGLPLYGHELGTDPDGKEIPIFACPLARFAVSFSPLKGAFIGRQVLEAQFQVFKAILERRPTDRAVLNRIIMPIAVTGKGIARAGCPVFRNGKPAGVVTSGTMVPYWVFDGEGIASVITERHGRRAIALALLDSRILEGDGVEVDVRGRRVPAVIVPYHLRSEAPPMARPVLYSDIRQGRRLTEPGMQKLDSANRLIRRALENTRWRQRECINLIPSEQSPSSLVKALSVMDPVGRYAEHKAVAAFQDAEVFYYQGTGFIAEVEALLAAELKSFLGCREVETRPVSGQMANMVVYSAMLDFINRADRKREPRRLSSIMNHHIIKGGHLSAQPMGALRDFVSRNTRTERPAVTNFPVLKDNPYQIDIDACRLAMEEARPELIILGKSMILHREPVREIRAMIDELGIDCVLLYDMAHVIGLVGPHYQEPFSEGADLVTGSTHKTFFGTQRGVVASNAAEGDVLYPLWEAIERRAFPGSVSNHHLGSLVGLLMAAYEMNAFKEDYQREVVANAKAFAGALKACGLDVAGDPAIGYTETHQVIVRVGYGLGPEVARRLEENHIIVNYQAGPDEEGFTASGALRMGVAEMTRFGMGPADFETLAQLMADCILDGKSVADSVKALRASFVEMAYCFTEGEMTDRLEGLLRWV